MSSPSSARPLSVGLNLLYLVEDAGGLGRYAVELIRGLQAAEPGTRITAFVSSELPDRLRESEWAAAVEWVTLPVTVTHGPPWNFLRTVGAQWGVLPWLGARRRLDVIHGLANITPLAAPRIARVTTVLDLIWMRFPETLDRRATLGMKLTTPPSARRADRVIAISQAAKRDLVATLGLRADRVDVTPLGIRLDDTTAPTPAAVLRERLGLGDRRVVLCVAQKRPHKNLANLVRAIARLGDDGTVLVLPGRSTPHESELRELADAEGIGERVRFPDWLPEEDLEGLYALADVFVLPSFEEGFGLPLLEAMRRGVAVACSDASSLPEVAGDAAELFDPASAEAIAAAVRRLLEDPGRRAELVERGHRRCREFTWERTARLTLETYRSAIGQRRS